MVLQLYQLGLPDASAGQPQDRIGARVQQQGLVEGGGTATEKVATNNVDLTLSGQWPYGERFTKKVSREGLSLAQSSFDAVPLFNAETSTLNEKTGFYEVANVDVSPAHETSTDNAEYTVQLNERGTRETHWRAVRTTQETVDTLFTGSDTSYVAIPTEATKTQWYDSQQGTENATKTDTVSSEFGDVDRYDPTNSTFTDPILLYEVSFDKIGPIDTVVWDDRKRTKFYTLESPGGSTDTTTQWSHVYHTGWEFDGSAVIDTGRLRLYVTEPDDVLVVESDETYTVEAGTTEVWRRSEVDGTLIVNGTLIETGAVGLYAEQWDANNNEWSRVSLSDSGSYELLDIDMTAIDPHEVQAQLLWTDGTSLDRVDAIFDRGHETVLWVEPDNETSTAQDIKDVLNTIARKTDTNVAPAQTVIARSETRS